jgi:hypothetical protein
VQTSPKTTPKRGRDGEGREPSASDEDQAFVVNSKKRRNSKGSKMKISALCSSEADE